MLNLSVLSVQNIGDVIVSPIQGVLQAEHFQRDLPTFIFYFFLWCSYYIIVKKHLIKGQLKINGKQQNRQEFLDLVNLVPAATHGYIAFAYGAYHYIYYNPPECGMVNDTLQRNCLMISISYFWYDTFCMALEGTID